MKILVVLSRPPYPLDKGDKLRAYYQLRELSKNNSVYLFCLNNRPFKTQIIEELSKIVDDVHVSGFNTKNSILGMIMSMITLRPFQCGYYTHPKNIKEFKDYCKTINPDVIYNQFVRTSSYWSKDYPCVLDFQDALSTNMDRRASKSIFPKSLLYKIEAILLRREERRMFDRFDKLTIIVEEDRKEIKHTRNNEIEIIPNGVDESYFNYKKQFNKEYDIIFSGGMSYQPNVVAAEYLIKEVMPLVWEINPQARVVIAGANPKKSLLKLQNDMVIITGWVDDMKEYYEKSKIFIAPMLIGTGLQNKLLEAMAMNLPCITSSLAGDALKATPDKEILIGNTPKEFAGHINNLIKDKELSNQIAENGNRFVKENYCWQTTVNKLEEILNEAVETNKKGYRN